MKQDANEFWKQSAEQMQQTLMNQWSGALQALQKMAPASGIPAAAADKLPAVSLSPSRLQQLQQQYLPQIQQKARTLDAGQIMAMVRGR